MCETFIENKKGGKKMKITGNVISGIILLIIGITLLLANFLGLKVNYFRLFPGIALLILGAAILFGQLGGKNEIIFDQTKIDISEPFNEKNIIFAEGIIDLNDLEAFSSYKKIEINTIFGSSQLILNPEIPTTIHGNTVFGSLQLPGHSVNFIGSTDYKTKDIDKNLPYLDIEANAVFGQFRVINSENK